MRMKAILIVLAIVIAKIQIMDQAYGNFSNLYEEIGKSEDSTCEDVAETYQATPSFYWRCWRCGYTDNPPWTNYCRGCKRHCYEEDDEDVSSS